MKGGGGIKLLSPRVAEGGNNMLTKFDMKIHIHHRKVGKEVTSGVRGMLEGKANGRRESLEINTF